MPSISLENCDDWRMVGRAFPFALIAVYPGGTALFCGSLCGKQVVYPKSIVLGEAKHSIVPPGINPSFGMVLAKNIG